MRVLVVRLTALGDVARTAEAAWALASSGHSVEWVVEEEFASLVEALPFVGNVFALPRRRLTRRLKNPASIPAILKEALEVMLDLRDRRYDVACDFQGNFRSGFVTFTSGARRRLGFSPAATYEAASLFYTKKLALPNPRPHKVAQLLLLARAAGAAIPNHPPPVRIDPAYTAPVEEFLYQHRALNRPLVVLHPGVSGFGAYKRWPAERYGRLAAMLRRAHGDVFVTLTWAGEEYDLAMRAARASGDAAVVAPRLNDLRSLMALLARATLVVGSDTGPIHLAALLRRPTVTIFGPKDERIYRPIGEGEVVTADVPCRPCRKRRCEDPVCIRNITVERVFEACSRMLKTS